MTAAEATDLSALYEADETAWLEAMADLARRGDAAGLDLENLAEFLTDMAKRERREVKSRLAVLLAHLLKWEHQPDRRSGSWRATILEQRQQLADAADRGVLRRHAEDVLVSAYTQAVEVAAAETGLPDAAFPAVCPYTLAAVLTADPGRG